MPNPSKVFAVGRLQRQLDAISDLRALDVSSAQFIQWERDTKVAISYAFGGDSWQAREFDGIRYTPVVVTFGLQDTQNREAFVEGLNAATGTLRSMINEIQEYWPDDTQVKDTAEHSETLQPVYPHRVFVIHGRDHGARDMVASFLRKMALQAVILEEQPSRGLTVIEKFEEHVQGDLAIAVLTPDDVGGLSFDYLQPRARQNVIFEFGYCIGKFGRDRVIVLVKGELDIPSDYSGVLYIPLDSAGGWQMKPIGEMKSAGFMIDANLAV